MPQLHANRRWKPSKGVALLASAVCCALGAGCHRAKPVSQAEQIRTVLNNFYATEPACLWTNPVTLERTRVGTATTETLTTKEARALVYAGLIEVEHHGHRLTNAGRSFWRDDPAKHGYGNLCFGKWNVDKIDSMVERPDGLFGNVTQTAFDATLASPALWTRVPAMQQAFPLMAAEVTGPLPHNATLRRTDKGWQIVAIEMPSVRP